jgi:hypothetical protein
MRSLRPWAHHRPHSAAGFDRGSVCVCAGEVASRLAIHKIMSLDKRSFGDGHDADSRRGVQRGRVSGRQCRGLAQALSAQDAGLAAREIARLALDHGGRDNVTAIVADVVARTHLRDGWLDYLPASSIARPWA